MRKLVCLEGYSSAGNTWEAGQVVSSDDEAMIDWLLRQAPSAWKEELPEAERVSKPAPDRAKKVIK